MPEKKINLIHPYVKVNSVTEQNPVIIHAEYIGPVECSDCKGIKLRTKALLSSILFYRSFLTFAVCAGVFYSVRGYFARSLPMSCKPFARVLPEAEQTT
jgi:hypothetical protein